MASHLRLPDGWSRRRTTTPDTAMGAPNPIVYEHDIEDHRIEIVPVQIGTSVGAMEWEVRAITGARSRILGRSLDQQGAIEIALTAVRGE